jgi:hypothetical protein
MLFLLVFIILLAPALNCSVPSHASPGTPHSYGNEVWGGIEYSFVTGTTRRPEGQRTYTDYDPVTGRSIRAAVRQQINIRIEAGPMFPAAFSSQDRCLVPTKGFAFGTGYGCFAYVPIFWFDDARTIDTVTMFRFFDHYYTRPGSRLYHVFMMKILLSLKKKRNFCF